MSFVFRYLRPWWMAAAFGLVAPMAHSWTLAQATLRDLSVLALDVGFGTPTLTWQAGSRGTSLDVAVHRPPGPDVQGSVSAPDWTSSLTTYRPDPPPQDPYTYTFAGASTNGSGNLLDAFAIASPMCCAAAADLTFGQSRIQRFGDFTISGRGVVVFKMTYLALVWNEIVVGDKDSRASVLMTASYADQGGSSSGQADYMVYSSGATDIAGKEGTLIVTITSNAGGGSGSLFAEAFAYSAAPITAVPEPGAYAMMLVGLGVIGLRLRGRKT